jgi:DNA-binding NtrC family response regulator
MRKYLRYADKKSRHLIGGESGTGKRFLIKSLEAKFNKDKNTTPKIVTVKKAEDLSEKAQFFITENRHLFDVGSTIIDSCLWIEPLRERSIDVAELTEYFLQTEGIETDRWYTSRSMKLLTDYWWPYNIKELKRVVTTEEGYKMLPYANLSKILSNYSATEVVSIKVESFLEELGDSVKPGKFYHLFLDSIERAFLKASLKQCNGSITQTSQLLNIHRNTLSQKIKKFRIKL